MTSISLFICALSISSFFFFNDTATTEIYTLSLHDALPIFAVLGSEAEASVSGREGRQRSGDEKLQHLTPRNGDRKSTRLNSSHGYISYAVFCLKKKKAPSHAPTGRPTASLPAHSPTVSRPI